ncbi:MAG: sulfatase-like hydrolase/transferase [Nannocystis sp.]|uniref:sulfatase-like hydrolase/transferase n=1 Tax=Nannocystis sp. TaxID=1962667 RepID=UPI002423B08A|nr:sulfatase-like hydrolase/transferase [Nannocystis sp.]MBK9757264.1 sulfatase-like hydrolase/transferase [Nannocystis sp.]
MLLPWSRWRPYRQHLLLLGVSVVAVVHLYGLSSFFWTGYGGASWSLYHLEMPFVLLTALLFYTPHGRRPRRRDLAYALLPVVLFYIAYDIFYAYFDRSMRVSDLQQFMLLQEVAPGWFYLVTSVLTAFVVQILWRHYKWFLTLPESSVARVAVAKAGILVAITVVLQSDWLGAVLLRSSSFVGWSEWRNIKDNGRFSCILYYHHRQQEAREKLARTDYPRIFDHLYHEPITRRRNVHVIVLESFLDPRKISGVEWEPSPLCPRLAPFLGPRGFSGVISPVKGGGTAQAEFELLTGLPALGLVNGIEFNSFEGFRGSTWVERLRQDGYTTVASIATKSGYYNTQRAYPTLGFTELHTLDFQPYFTIEDGDDLLADSSLYRANLRLLSEDLLARRPFVNYLLTMEGHHPYWRNRGRDPDIIAPRGPTEPGQEIVDIANLFYYRTCALADFLSELRRLDPDSIVLAISDHLPPVVFEGEISYPSGLYFNVALLLDGFEPVDLSPEKYPPGRPRAVAPLDWGAGAGAATRRCATRVAVLRAARRERVRWRRIARRRRPGRPSPAASWSRLADLSDSVDAADRCRSAASRRISRFNA